MVNPKNLSKFVLAFYYNELMKEYHFLRKYLRVAIIMATTITFFFTISCSGDKLDVDSKAPKREALPTMTASNVNTIISDSGVARFRIVAPEWIVYDKVQEPYWEFKKGIHFERFDQSQKIDAYMDAKKARYNQAKSLWEFNGDVQIKNLKGEIFTTQQLFWNEAIGKFYSDKEINIKQRTKTITGIGFESNSSFTRYIIRRPTAIIPVANQ